MVDDNGEKVLGTVGVAVTAAAAAVVDGWNNVIRLW